MAAASLFLLGTFRNEDRFLGVLLGLLKPQDAENSPDADLDAKLCCLVVCVCAFVRACVAFVRVFEPILDELEARG